MAITAACGTVIAVAAGLVLRIMSGTWNVATPRGRLSFLATGAHGLGIVGLRPTAAQVLVPVADPTGVGR